jgi:hypothetical protein
VGRGKSSLGGAQCVDALACSVRRGIGGVRVRDGEVTASPRICLLRCVRADGPRLDRCGEAATSRDANAEQTPACSRELGARDMA